MARTVQTARRWIKSSNIFLQAWKNQPLDPNFNMLKYLRELIKYYPKNFRALKFLILTPEGERKPQGSSEAQLQLRKILYAKYSRTYIRHIEIPENAQKFERVKSLSLSSLKITELNIISKQKALIRSIKYIRSFELQINPQTAGSLIFNLRKIKSITSLTITNLHPLPLEHYERIFRPLKSHLKSLTIKGIFFLASEFDKNPVKFPELLEFFFNLPNLQVFNLDASDEKPMNLDSIPLDILKQKGIKFDVRLGHFRIQNTLISWKNSQALSDIQVLGINNQQSFSQSEPTWDCIEEAHLDIQKNTRGNLFYINRMEIKSESLFKLFSTCKNISTLNLMIISHPELADFAPLRELSNLQNFFVQLVDMEKPLSNLFESLGALAQTYKKLEFASFEFLRGQIGEDYLIAESFFDASRNILKKIILKFRLIKGDISGIKYFYQGLKKLEQIASLSILIQDPLQIPCATKTQDCTCHYNLLTDLLENFNSLTEANLSLPQIHEDKDLAINYNLSKSIKKLGLDLQYGYPCEYLVNNISTLVNLQQLDLSLAFSPPTLWQSIFHALHELEKLEILRLKFSSHLTFSPLENLKFFMETKHNLKFILLSVIGFALQECFVLTRKGYHNGDVDGFLATGRCGIPVKVLPTKTFYYQ